MKLRNLLKNLNFKLLGLIMSALYVVFIIVAHDSMVNVSIYLMNLGGLEQYNKQVITFFGLIGVAVFSFLILKIFQSKVQSFSKLSFLLVYSAFLTLHSAFLLEMNIELIHTLQYSILAILLYAGLRNFGLGAALSILVMLIDELYQYLVLYPFYVFYLEFNDMVLNLLAISLTYCGIWILGFKNRKLQLKHLDYAIVASLWLILGLGISTCIFSFYEPTACKNTILVFNKLPENNTFWQIHHFTGARYHVLSPIAGMTAITMIFISVKWMEYQMKKPPAKS